MSLTADLKSHFKFIKTPDEAIAYVIKGSALKDSWNSIVVIHNAKLANMKVTLPTQGDWNVVVEGNKAGTKILRTIRNANLVEIKPLSTMVLYSK
jgi:pullulanase